MHSTNVALVMISMQELLKLNILLDSDEPDNIARQLVNVCIIIPTMNNNNQQKYIINLCNLYRMPLSVIASFLCRMCIFYLEAFDFPLLRQCDYSLDRMFRTSNAAYKVAT